MSATEGPPGDRLIAVLTTGRQDWGLLRSTSRALIATPGLRLRLLAGGMHLDPRHGRSVEELRADGFVPDAELAWLGAASGREMDQDPPASEQAARALAAIGDELGRARPDALVLAGDRFETAAAALAATVTGVPIVHLHGGEQTSGAFDDVLRHAISKLSHLHLVSRPEHAARLLALGEDPATVHVVGSPGLDNASRDDLPDRADLERDLGISLRPPVVIVTVHPATLDADPGATVQAVVAAMDAVPATFVVTLPNSDPGGDLARRQLNAAVDRAPRDPSGAATTVAVGALGTRRYWGLLRIADAMLGNSSSGLIEAPAVGLPVVNVGDRQEGRAREANVIDVEPVGSAVAAALRRALQPETRSTIGARRLHQSDGQAGERIARIIAEWHPDHPPRKAPIVVADDR